MGLFDALNVSASGLSAERLRMSVTAENLANAQTTRTAEGGPYLRKHVSLQTAAGSSFGAALASAIGPNGPNVSSAIGTAAGRPGRADRPGGGVEVAGIASDANATRRIHDPGHPDADAEGYVTMPDIEPVSEMVDLITAQRGYEANVTAMQATKSMFSKTMELLR